MEPTTVSQFDDSGKNQPFDPKKVQTMFQKETERRQLQKAKKQLPRQNQPKPSRRKNWLLDETDESAYHADERVMPRGESERRRRVLEAAQTDPLETEPLPPTQRHGVVIEVSSGLNQVDLGQRILPCRLRGSLKAAQTGYTNLVAVGDEVIISEDGAGYGVIEQVLPRRSALTRPDVFHRHRQQVIVANADQLLIVASWRNPPLWLELIDRYLVAAQRYHLTPLICLNKIDLATAEGRRADSQALLQPYQDLAYPLILTSARTGEGIHLLRQTLRGRITALAGLSGVGKSSLLNAVQPGLQLRTGEVSDWSGEGQHTTNRVTMLKLAEGGFVVDTPGIREFGLSGLSKAELIEFYPDLAAHAPRCRFSNCAHRNEPDCALKMAVAQGHVAASRYDTYLKIRDTLPG
jgi:ribosome biogenesis GTPase